jgi:hypothetical protein
MNYWVSPSIEDLSIISDKPLYQQNYERILSYYNLGLDYIVYGEGKVTLFRSKQSVRITTRRILLSHFNGICPLCGETGISTQLKNHTDYTDSKGKLFHVDHIIPISKGGTNNINNLRLTCPKCNLSKKEKIWLE